MPSSFHHATPSSPYALHPHPFIQEKRASSPCATHLLTRDLRKITSLVRCAPGAFSAYFSLFETANAPPPVGFSLRPPGGRQETPPSKLPSWHRQSLLPAIPLSSPRSPSHHFRRDRQRLKALGARPSLLYAHRGLSLCSCAHRGLFRCKPRHVGRRRRSRKTNSKTQRAGVSTRQRVNVPTCSADSRFGPHPFLKREKGPKLHASALCVRFRPCERTWLSARCCRRRPCRRT